MLELDGTLEKRLKRLRVHIDAPDGDTLFFRNVPANKRFFNKPRTNLLIKRAREKMPFLVCVDEDLEYTGADEELARIFTISTRQQGWRVLHLQAAAQCDVHKVLERALEVLGCVVRDTEAQDEKVTHTGKRESNLLAIFGVNLSRIVAEGNAEPTQGREGLISDVVSCLLQWQPVMPVITGHTGAGKTNLLYGVARALRERQASTQLISVDAGVLMACTMFEAERENLFAALLKEARFRGGTIIALEHAERALLGGPSAPWLLSDALDKGLRIVGTTPRNFGFDFTFLRRRVMEIELVEMSPAETLKVLLTIKDRLSAHHSVEIDESALRTVIEASRTLAGCYPSKAISLLDAACARARLNGARALNAQDLLLASARFTEDEEYPSLLASHI